MDFDFNEDFELDTGINIGKDGYNDGESMDMNMEGRDDVKRTAIFSIIAGVVIIVIAFSIIGVANKIKGNNKDAGNGIEEAVTEVKGPISNADIENTMQIEMRHKDRVEEWVTFKKDESIKLDKSVEALFTVTSIQHVAKIVNDKNDKIIKSILKGSISGITGTYEIEVPYEKARLLDDGTVFTIKYNYTIQNGVRIVGEIQY